MVMRMSKDEFVYMERSAKIKVELDDVIGVKEK